MIQLRSFVLCVLLATVATLPACYIARNDPAGEPVGKRVVKGAGEGAAVGAMFGPWGELIGAVGGGLVAAAGAYHVGHGRGRKREKRETPQRAAALVDPPNPFRAPPSPLLDPLNPQSPLNPLNPLNA